jgi:hypothetical protein
MPFSNPAPSNVNTAISGDLDGGQPLTTFEDVDGGKPDTGFFEATDDGGTT